MLGEFTAQNKALKTIFDEEKLTAGILFMMEWGKIITEEPGWLLCCHIKSACLHRWCSSG